MIFVVMKKSVRVIAPRCLRGHLKEKHDHSSPDPLRWVSSKALYDTPVVSGTDCARTTKQLCWEQRVSQVHELRANKFTTRDSCRIGSVACFWSQIATTGSKSLHWPDSLRYIITCGLRHAHIRMRSRLVNTRKNTYWNLDCSVISMKLYLN